MLEGDSELFHRRGIIVVSGDVIRNNPEPLLHVFARAIPLEAFHSIVHDSIEYLCLSPDFRLLKSGEKVPTYMVKVEEKINECEVFYEISFTENQPMEDLLGLPKLNS